MQVFIKSFHCHLGAVQSTHNWVSPRLRHKLIAQFRVLRRWVQVLSHTFGLSARLTGVMTVAKPQTLLSFEELLVSLSTFNSNLKSDEMKLSREGYLLGHFAVKSLCYCWCLSCDSSGRLPQSGVMPGRRYVSVCGSRVVEGKNKEEKQAQCSLWAALFARYFRGIFKWERNLWMF